MTSKSFKRKFLKLKFGVNDVIKVKYFCVSQNSRKTFSLIGLCIGISFKHKSFKIQNIFNGEQFEITFSILSPYIIDIEKLKNYSFKFKKSKLFFKKFFYLEEPPYTLVKKFQTKENLDPVNFIFSNNVSKVKIRNIRDKFRI